MLNLIGATGLLAVGCVYQPDSASETPPQGREVYNTMLEISLPGTLISSRITRVGENKFIITSVSNDSLRARDFAAAIATMRAKGCEIADIKTIVSQERMEWVEVTVSNFESCLPKVK